MPHLHDKKVPGLGPEGVGWWEVSAFQVKVRPRKFYGGCISAEIATQLKPEKQAVDWETYF